MSRLPFAALLLAAATALGPHRAAAQDDGPLHIEINDGVIEPLRIALPAFADEGGADLMTAEFRDVVAADLTSTGLFHEIPFAAQIARPDGFDTPVAWDDWRAVNADALAIGGLRVEGDRIKARFRLHDVVAGQLLGEGMEFDASLGNWRRAAHKMADQIYTRLTGEAPYLDSRIAFVAESGPAAARVKRLAIMDADGAGIKFLTDGSTLALAPRFTPDGTGLLFTSFAQGSPRLALLDLASVQARPVPGAAGTMSFAPRLSPDGRWIVYSQERGGNTDIWLMDAATGAARPLTSEPSIDTAPSFSPDGRRVVFESDRSGSQQLYLMTLDTGAVARLTFGPGRYGAPVWAPKGELIAFVRRDRADDGVRDDGASPSQGRGSTIGIIRADGSGERLLTDGHRDDGPSWAPNGRVLVFTRRGRNALSAPRLAVADVTGGEVREISAAGAASDPDWGPLLP